MRQILFLLLITIALSTKGVDLSQPFATSVYTCFKNSGINFAIIRAYCSYGGVDSHAVSNLQNAHAAGIPYVDTYFFPCRGKSASAQVTEFFSGVPSSLYGMVWLDIETNPSSGCSWSGHDAASNCAYVQELVNAIKAKGKNPGIYASIYMWESIMGSRGACTGVAGQPLWYAHYDNNPSFSDYSTIGGWSKPAIKQYQGDTTLCGAGVDMNWYP
jgi:GH25 family lysozyme M1 (1,4-beta-N-acetylmuramidase)